MDGIGEEVYIFGILSLIAGVLLYKTLVYIFGQLGDNIGQSDDTDIGSRGRTRSNQSQCSICLDDAKFAAETNCGHVFCSDCILEVWRQSSQLSASPCPYCRQRITIMLPYFTIEEANSAEPADAEMRRKLFHEMSIYNRMYSGEPRSMVEHVRDLPMLLRHLVTRLFSGEGLHLAFQVRIVVLSVVWVVYLLSPVDLIPEALFGAVGLLDDILIFLLLATWLAVTFRTLMTAHLGNAGT